MTSEQGPGGGAVGGSPPMPNTQNEQMQDAEAENRMSQQQDDGQAQYAQPSQVSPRQLEELGAPSAAGTPSSNRLRHSCPSACSSNPSTPVRNMAESYTPEYRARPQASSATKASPPPMKALPPVTKSSLSELDVTKIIHNPKLRHDINFDPDLHFRPNLEGEKGRTKYDKATLFWNALQEQLTAFVVDREAFHTKYGDGDDWCLPSLLKAVKEIIQTLVPQRDRVYLEEGLNVDLLMQQFNRGVADLEKLASWLSCVLKSHCAPMRDEWVDEMYNQLSNGNQNNDMGELVKGMRSLLSVLEAMKLDVANHQIRCLRPVLIEDTVHFEQRYFFKKIHSGKTDILPATLWYRDACERYSSLLADPANTQAFGDSTIFFEALSRLLLPSVDEKTLPNTFNFDEDRMLKLRSDMMDMVNLEVCMRAYEDIETGYGAMLVSAFQGLGEQARPGTPDSVFSASGSLASSRPSSLILTPTSSANPSPRSSVIIPSHPAPDTGRGKLLKSQELYSSLKAILQTAPHASRPMSRWRAIAPSMALQVFRFTNAPPQALSIIESNITNLVCDVHSGRYRELEEYFLGKLMAELAKRVKQYRGLSGVSLYNIATGGRAWDSSPERGRETMAGDGPMREGREDEAIAGMAGRLAHLGTIHWRVWSGLAYTEDPDTPMESPSS
ncbi:TCP11 family protein [Candidatus Bathyarchaeota archaeon]|nr:TCP11 family protein [Candidatus Bathyarchaeota archaeon]